MGGGADTLLKSKSHSTLSVDPGGMVKRPFIINGIETRGEGDETRRDRAAEDW
jgi:hypothetical protein